METKESLIVALFDAEDEAYQAYTELKAAAVTPEYLVGEAAVMTKEDGAMKVVDRFAADPEAYGDRARWGAVGALVGLLGGPMGMLLGGGFGTLVGTMVDNDDAARDASVIDIIAGKLYDGDTVVVMVAREAPGCPIDRVLEKHTSYIIRRDAATVAEEVEELEEVEREAEEKARGVLRAEKSEERRARIGKRREAMKARFDSYGK